METSLDHADERDLIETFVERSRWHCRAARETFSTDEFRPVTTVLASTRPCVLTASRRTVIMPADLPTLQRSPMPRQRLSSTGVTEYRIGTAASVCLDVECPDDIAPLLGFVGDELAEVGRRAWKCGGAPLGKPRLHLGIGKGRVDLRVELVDDLGWRVARRADAGPEAKLIARHKFGNRREVRQHRRACRDGYCQRAKFPGPDVCDR